MYRLAALSGIAALLVTVTPADAAAETVEVPKTIELAQMKPSVSAIPDIAPVDMIEPAVMKPSRVLSPRANLAARFTPGPRLVAKVDVSDQTMHVIVDGEVRHTWKVSTAGKGYKTPRGIWKPYRMHTMWYSRKYDNAPMPHSIFYDGGYAIHATPHVKRLGSPASHGCVRLHPENAKALFSLVKEYGRDSMRVVVQN